MQQVDNVTQQINITLQPKVKIQILKLTCPLQACLYAYTLTLNCFSPKMWSKYNLIFSLTKQFFPVLPHKSPFPISGEPNQSNIYLLFNRGGGESWKFLKRAQSLSLPPTPKCHVAHCPFITENQKHLFMKQARNLH